MGHHRVGVAGGMVDVQVRRSPSSGEHTWYVYPRDGTDLQEPSTHMALVAEIERLKVSTGL